ncbi:hypothetical protein JB92DRAFT_3113142 [Gautieria morchelliformis]|nr:hypothetical protein JB92DRAFT_3113142 [Gautieria morchelliformis]
MHACVSRVLAVSHTPAIQAHPSPAPSPQLASAPSMTAGSCHDQPRAPTRDVEGRDPTAQRTAVMCSNATRTCHTSRSPTLFPRNRMPHNEANSSDTGAAHTSAIARMPTREIATQTNDAAPHTREAAAQITPHTSKHPVHSHELTYESATQGNGMATWMHETASQAMTPTASSSSASPSASPSSVMITPSSTSMPIPLSSQTSATSAHSTASSSPTDLTMTITKPSDPPSHAVITSNAPRLVAAMPLRRSKRAPKLFEGEEEDIAEFLDAYERCADDAQLPKNERVKVIFRYLHWSQELIFKAFDGYATEDWDVFKVSIKEAFGCKD